MGHLLNSGEVGQIGLNQMRKNRKLVQEKWESLGFCDGLNGHIKENMAQLFENQANYLLNESTTAADSSGSFETVVFPIVRRVFSKLLANDIVSVQAMNLPIGKLFFFVPQTSTRLDANGNPINLAESFSGGAEGNHTSLATDHLPDCVVGVNCQPTQFEAKNLYDLYYNDGLFDNSKGKATVNVVAGPLAVALDASGNYSALGANGYAVATDNTVRNAIICVSGFNATNKGRLTGPDGNEMDSEAFLSTLKINYSADVTDPQGNIIVAADAEIPFRLVTQKYGKGIVEYDDICDSEGNIYLDLDVTHPAGAGVSTFDGYIGTTGNTISTDAQAFADALNVAWVSYETLELETDLAEVTFKLDEVVVSVQERKLRATWSPELAQDVSAFHNIDAEAELTALLSEQIAAEIDREILRDIRKAAAWQLRWDYNGWRKVSNVASPYTQKDWNQTLITKVNQVSAQIHKSTLRGGANFIVVSSEISAIFDDLEYFHVSDANPEQDQYNMGIEKIGSLSGRYTVYRDPYAPAYSMIIGHKGKSLLDTGYIYAPYVPLQLTPTIYNPFNFAPVKGIMTRYAKKVVNNRFYGHIRVDGIPTFDTRELR